MPKKAFLFFGCICLLCAGAAALGAQQNKQEQREPSPASPQTITPGKPAASEGGGAPVDPSTYRIGPEDVLAIRVWREPELSGLFVVRPDGVITLPLIGEIKTGDQTPDQLKQQLVEALTKFINRPEVMVSVQSVQSKKYYLVGEVLRPGVYPLVVPTTVLEALNAAGGFRDFAKKGKITILRGDKRLKFNYEDVIKGKNMQQNIPVQNGDHIVVP